MGRKVLKRFRPIQEAYARNLEANQSLAFSALLVDDPGKVRDLSILHMLDTETEIHEIELSH